MTIWAFLQSPRIQEEENPYSCLMPKNMNTQKSDERREKTEKEDQEKSDFEFLQASFYLSQ